MNVRSFLCALLVAALAGAALAQDEGPAPPPGAGGPSPVTAAERVKRLEGVLEGIRGKKFKHDVGVETQTAEDFRKFVDREIDKDLPSEKAVAVSKTLQAFGLLPKGYDLRKGLSDLYVSQAGAYYNPETQKFYMLIVSMPDESLDVMIVHELMHALQDQYHGLAARTKAVAAKHDDDATAAFQSIVEGEATLVMTEYELQQKGFDLSAMPPPMQENVFGALTKLDRATLLEQTEAQSDTIGKGGDEIKNAVAALKSMPGYLFWSLHAPYFRGQYAVFKTESARGWDAVDALLEKPPASTEQVFHPEKLPGGPKTDEPVPVLLATDAIAAALGDGWKLLHTNVLGELGVFSLMDEKLPPESPGAESARGRIAAGWGGDRYAAFEQAGAGEVALVWRTVWDTEKDAAEFADGLAAAGFKGESVTRGKEVDVLRHVPAEAKERVMATFAK